MPSPGRVGRTSSSPLADPGPPDELEFIGRFLKPLAGEGAFDLQDDAALIAPPPGQELVLTMDTIAAGVHFLPDDPSEAVARKALRVNLSDLAAKGAAPLGYLLSAGLTEGCGAAWLTGFVEGLAADQSAFGLSLLGGDTVRVLQGPVFTVTALGLLPAGGMVHRFGGRPGDRLYVTGTIGLARAGLALLRGEPGEWAELPKSAWAAAIARYRLPEPRMAAAPLLRRHASAAMDVSDGLIGDLDKMAAASGCSAVLHADRVPLHPGLAPLADDRQTLLALLSGGDDYEILAATAPEHGEAFAREMAAVGLPVACVGELCAGSEPATVFVGGEPIEATARAYVHGGRSRTP